MAIGKTTGLRRAHHFVVVSQIVASILSMQLFPSLVEARPSGLRASFTASNATLTVRVKAPDAEVVLFDDVLDQELSRTPAVQGGLKVFTIPAMPVSPCRVRVEAGGKSALKAVSGAACLGTSKPPTCKIVSPTGPQSIPFGGKLSFQGQLRGARTRHLSYEWDFGGGADARPTEAATGVVTFDQVSDTRVWVTFSAADLTGARCADRVQVTIGNPPEHPVKVPEQPVPGLTGAGDGEHVVLPFTPFGMEFHDLSYRDFPQTYPINWLNAVTLKKGTVGGGKPVVLAPGDGVELRYSAASSPHDPVGSDSINSTSQNYPVGTAFDQASIRKSDYYDPCLRSGQPYQPQGSDHVITHAACAFADFWDIDGGKGEDQWSVVDILPDEGQLTYDPDYFWIHYGGSVGLHEPTGVPMPGISGPYVKNEPQAAFKDFDPERGTFAARGIAMFPTDDQGRHNAYPLMRVQAVDPSSATTLATTDAVMAVTTEYHCAECHSFGKVGADQKIYDDLRAKIESSTDPDLAKYKERLRFIPHFLKPEDVDAARKEQRDVIERAAQLNAFLLHDFTYSFARELNISEAWPTDLANRTIGTPDNCGSWCHRSAPRTDPVSWGPMLPDWVSGGGTTCPEYSNGLHNTHGRFMGTLNSDFTGMIERDPVTQSFKLLDLSKSPSSQSAPLLQAADAGNTDKSCLFCHSGVKDKYQRDVMSAAGVNCIDCHGDMVVQAGGTAMANRTSGGAGNPPNSQSEKFTEFHRLTWINLPSCASCHTGVGDEPVRRRAYDMTTTAFRSLAATNERFAENLTPKVTTAEVNEKSAIVPVVLTENGKSCPPGTFADTVSPGSHDCVRGLFKDSLDRHAKLPCASCHGSPHAIWPNPNPYHNDNVTALQLQGHTGTLLECRACHEKDGSADVFFQAGDSREVILDFLKNGPHDMHPVADSRFIFNDKLDATPAHQISHADLARFYNAEKGAGRKDLCAECHGDDHAGSRLSKTPIDRVLAVSDPARADLQPGTKKEVHVKKNQEIGCDLCHSLELSFTQ